MWRNFVYMINMLKGRIFFKEKDLVDFVSNLS